MRAAFLTEKPFIKDVLDDMTAREVYVVPNLACAGFISTTKLPGTLNLTGTVTERVTPHGHQRVFLTVPVGTAPSLPKIMANRILTAMETMAVDPNETAIILIGHGSQKSRNPLSTPIVSPRTWPAKISEHRS